MREQDDPFVANELMKIDGSICRFSLEVGRYATQAQTAKGQLSSMEQSCPNLARDGCLRLCAFFVTHVDDVLRSADEDDRQLTH